ncbi:Cyclochlorotine biosynthesis protein O [Colletotrichum siamense]|nr:Cyclochlorotine biosynthesis protein O [Colletotrichum siamense]
MLPVIEKATYNRVPPSDESSDGSYSEETTLMQEGFVKRRSGSCSLLFKSLCVLAVLILHSAALIQISAHIFRAGRMQGTRAMYSIVDGFLQYEFREFYQFEKGLQNVTYFTEPDAEVDRNWHNILAHQNIRIPKHTMEELGRVDEGIELPGGDYFGSIMVYHHLHCLKNLYHALHPEYYNFSKLTSHEQERLAEHNDHCLHMLREAVMCQGDTTLITMKWNSTGLRPIGNLTSPHECVNWDRLMEWVVPNSFDALADGMLVHPTSGMDPVPFSDVSHNDRYSAIAN